MYFKRKELEKFRCFKGPLIDVRSPSEYYKGHMPNSINIPLFDNNERSIIGTIYKKKGREIAVIEGLKIFEKKLKLLLDNLFMNMVGIFLKFMIFLYQFTSGTIRKGLPDFRPGSLLSKFNLLKTHLRVFFL